ncbi:hypothetical protein ACX0HA_08470 [Flavobacterium hauense]
MSQVLKPFSVLFGLLILISCQKESKSNNAEKLLFDQYKESEHFYQTNLNDYEQFISGYISENPKLGLFPSFDSIKKIKTIVDRTVAQIDETKGPDKKNLISDSRNEIEKLSHYKFEFIDLKSLEGLNDSLYSQAVKTDLLRANYNIFLQYSHDKMKQ